MLGMSKAGLKGMGISVVILMALVYKAKASRGILLPMLITADIIAVVYYRRVVRWDYLKRFLPWMIAGVLFGTYVGKGMPEEIFKKGMATIILISVLIIIAWERYDKSKIPDTLWFTGSMGFAAGFTTMIGNLAGAFSNIFFLASRIPKVEFIGTAAWMFFFINLF
ncbi:MAG: sulfite exporter TauE/SafE family protein [Saprospiraceae bacterium]